MFSETTQAYLEQVRIPLRLACADASGWPLVLSLWYLYEDGYLYCATKEHAKVVAHLRANQRCAFEVASDQPPYCGVRGQAIASIEKQRGKEILERLLIRYLGSHETPLAKKLLAQVNLEVAIRLEPTRVYNWNFKERMRGSVISESDKLCPD